METNCRIRTELDGALHIREMTLPEVVRYVGNHPGDNSLARFIRGSYDGAKRFALLETAALMGALRHPVFDELASDLI